MSKTNNILMPPLTFKLANGAASGATQTPVEPTTNPPGVPLPTSIDQLIYFDGRILKASHFDLEANGLLLRAALSERAQGAGVSYGFHVTAASQPVSISFVDLVAQSVVDKIKLDPSIWIQILSGNNPTPSGSGSASDAAGSVLAAAKAAAGASTDTPGFDATVVARLANAVEQVCGAETGNIGQGTFVVGPGHAADGYGKDLYLPQTATVSLSDLITKFLGWPTQCVQPGPSISPAPMSGAPQLTGAFLLCAYLNSNDHGNEPVYGVQCGDNSTTACSFGTHSEGVGLQLVFFDALASESATPDDVIGWRGAGARAYFEKETATRDTLLPSMLQQLPFDHAALAPDTGSHVPIGMVYLSNGNLVAYDEWTAKRLRTPAELDYWLRALANPSKPSQLARVLQFQSQLTDALAKTTSTISKVASLWNLGFVDGTELVLPGVGFLPVPLIRESKNAASVLSASEVNQINTYVASYFDGVPYKLLPTTPGELNGLFTGALESGELRLTRTSKSKITPIDQIFELEQLLTVATAPAPAAAPAAQPAVDPTAASTERLLINTNVSSFNTNLGVNTIDSSLLINWFRRFNLRQPLLPPQVLVWYPQSDYRGYVMFTWPAADIQQQTEVHLCVKAQLDLLVPPQRVATSGAGTVSGTYTNNLGTVSKSGGVFQPFQATGRDNERVGSLNIALTFEAGTRAFEPFQVGGISLIVDPQVANVQLRYKAYSQKSQSPSWTQEGDWAYGDDFGLSGFAVDVLDATTGAPSSDYDVRYMARFTLIADNFVENFDSGFFANGQVVGIGDGVVQYFPGIFLPYDQSQLQMIRLNELLVRVVPKGCVQPIAGPPGKAPAPAPSGAGSVLSLLR